MTNVKNPPKDVISEAEVNRMLNLAEAISDKFRRLRAKATLSLLETGKRRSELATLQKQDLTTDDTYLYVRFTVVKKRKKNIRTLQRTKKFRKNSQWATYILEYLDYVKQKFPETPYLYPRGKCLFGQIFIADPMKHANGQEIWRIIKTLNPNDWPHQHREKRAVKVIKTAEAKHGQADLNTVYQVRDVLDLERETTAYAYIRRYQTQRVEEEDETIT